MIRRGEIYFACLDPTEGREQAGVRPVLVVSDDVINALPLVVVVIVGTKASNVGKEYPTNVLVRAQESGLPLDTVFLGFQIRSLDPRRLVDPATKKLGCAGKVLPETMAKVDEALRLTLSL